MMRKQGITTTALGQKIGLMKINHLVDMRSVLPEAAPLGVKTFYFTSWVKVHLLEGSDLVHSSFI